MRRTARRNAAGSGPGRDPRGASLQRWPRSPRRCRHAPRGPLCHRGRRSGASPDRPALPEARRDMRPGGRARSPAPAAPSRHRAPLPHRYCRAPPPCKGGARGRGVRPRGPAPREGSPGESLRAPPSRGRRRRPGSSPGRARDLADAPGSGPPLSARAGPSTPSRQTRPEQARSRPRPAAGRPRSKRDRRV